MLPFAAVYQSARRYDSELVFSQIFEGRRFSNIHRRCHKILHFWLECSVERSCEMSAVCRQQLCSRILMHSTHKLRIMVTLSV